MEALQTLGTAAAAHGMLPGAPSSLEELRMRQMMMAQMGGAGAPAAMAGIPGMPGAGPLGGHLPQVSPQESLFEREQQIQRVKLLQQMQAQQQIGESIRSAASVWSMEEPALQRMKLEHPGAAELQLHQHQLQLQREQQLQEQQALNGHDANGVPKTIAAHTHLLELTDPDGSRLRAYYRLSVDEVFGFPPTPTDEEYITRLNVPGMTPDMIPGTHLAALSAARFAEVALGAIVHNETTLAMELCNAVVHCLKESVQYPVKSPYMFEVAKSYFLLAVFRSFRGDMVRYFKYRRVCLTYVSKLDVSTLLSKKSATSETCFTEGSHQLFSFAFSFA